MIQVLLQCYHFDSMPVYKFVSSPIHEAENAAAQTEWAEEVEGEIRSIP